MPFEYDIMEKEDDENDTTMRPMGTRESSKVDHQCSVPEARYQPNALRSFKTKEMLHGQPHTHSSANRAWLLPSNQRLPVSSGKTRQGFRLAPAERVNDWNSAGPSRSHRAGYSRKSTKERGKETSGPTRPLVFLSPAGDLSGRSCTGWARRPRTPSRSR